jgi:hypothetical protein
LKHLHQGLVEAEQASLAQESAVEQARRGLEQARVEQETFESHRQGALDDHCRETGRRQQAAADQDWLARQHTQEPTP